MLGAPVCEAGSEQVQATFDAHAVDGVLAPGAEASRELRHEVGNALTAASVYAQWLLLRQVPGTDTREYQALEAIRDSVARALRLIDRHTVSQHTMPRSLQELVEVAVRQVPSPRMHDIRIRRVSQDAPEVSADPDAVVQIVTNLLSNAEKYSPPGTPIDVELGRVNGKAHLTVRDRGIGFEAGLTDAIFAGFRTPRARQMADGQGIGLRLSRRLARQAGGRLWAASVPGRETSFHLELPLADGNASAQPGAISVDAAIRPATT
jgi:two-component system, OmpR family, sensor histidine kinase MprB